MRTLLEKAIVQLLNGDQGKAEALFHKFIVERAREIHKSLRQNEDVQLNEGWDTEIQEEEYFDDIGDKDDGLDDAPEMAGAEGDMAGAEDDMAGAETDMADADADMGDVDGLDDMVDDEGGDAGGGDLESKLDDIEAKMDELSAEFDRIMSELGGGDAGDDDGLGDDDDLEGLGGDDLGDDGLGGEAEGLGDEMGDVADEGDDLADRMEDDLGDEHQPEHEMAEGEEPEMDSEDDEMLEDITESVLAELEKVSVPPMTTDGKEIGSAGKTVAGHHTDMLPHHPASDRVNQAKPYMVKGGNNDLFERETPPTSGKVKIQARNNDAGVKKLKSVPKDGDGSALINKDFAPGRPDTQPTIDGKKSK